MDSNIRLCEIYNDGLRNYGQKYKNYSSIKEGDIMYYYDKSIENSLFNPIFENPANVESQLYKDPMASIAYPEYIRNPIYKSNLLKTKNRDYRYNLSAIDDQNEFREDIIHLQMRPQDRTKYSARWTGDRIY